jgi:hypothetical protein
METLYTFGCSYTYGDETSQYYIDSSKPSSTAWPSLLADRLNLDCVNLGVSGSSNDFILKTVLLNLDRISKNDTVVVMMTFPDRKLINNYAEDKIVNAMPNNKKYHNYYLKYHTEELGILNFIQNFLSLQELLKEYSYYITFTTYEPVILFKKYQWARNYVINKQKTIKPPKLGFFSLVDTFKQKHPDDSGHKIITDTLYKFIKK